MRLTMHGLMWMLGFVVGAVFNYVVVQNTPELLSALNDAGIEGMIGYYAGGGLAMGFMLYGFSKALGEIVNAVNRVFKHVTYKIRERRVLKAWSRV
jgi:hypothetical protein